MSYGVLFVTVVLCLTVAGLLYLHRNQGFDPAEALRLVEEGEFRVIRESGNFFDKESFEAILWGNRCRIKYVRAFLDGPEFETIVMLSLHRGSFGFVGAEWLDGALKEWFRGAGRFRTTGPLTVRDRAASVDLLRAIHKALTQKP